MTPTQLFWSAVGVHLALWTLIPTLTSPNAPLDVIEGYAWGREWLIGTYKHPPLQAWILEIFARVTGRAAWAHFFASQLAVVIAFWAVWRTGLRLTKPVPALLGVLLLEGIAYYNFTSPEFNPNVLQLPFWALAAWSFHRAVKENKLLDWAELGVWAAGGLYTKYSMGLLLVVLALLIIGHPEGRRRLRGPGPYLALAVAVVLFLPHLRWLADHQFQPFGYAESRTVQALKFYQRFTQPFSFLMAQVLSLLAMFILFAVTAWGRGIAVARNLTWSSKGRLTPHLQKPRRYCVTPGFCFLPLKGGGGHRAFREFVTGKTSFDRLFLHAITFGPLVFVILAAMAAGFRPRDMWGSCLWNFIGLWLIVFVAPSLNSAALKRFFRGWVVIFILALAIYAGSNQFYPSIKKKTLRVHFPGKALAEAVTQGWWERFQKPFAVGQKPLTYIIGDTWLAGNAAYYAQGMPASSRPHIVIAPGVAASPWALPEDVWSKGGILVWCSDKCRHNVDVYQIPPHLKWRFPGAEIQTPLTFPYETKEQLEPATIGWALLPPASRWPEKRARGLKPALPFLR